MNTTDACNRKNPQNVNLFMMLITALAFAIPAAIGANIFHKSAISTAHMLSHTSPHACGTC